MKYDWQIRMQQRQLTAIIGALKFVHKFFAGDLSGTLGVAARDAWRALPTEAHDVYPARIGDERTIRMEITELCKTIEEIVWRGCPSNQPFEDSENGKIVASLLTQRKTRAKWTYFFVKVTDVELRRFLWAVDFECYVRRGDHQCVMSGLGEEIKKRYVEVKDGTHAEARLSANVKRLRELAWGLEGKMFYGNWFSHRTRFLCDIAQAIKKVTGELETSIAVQLTPNVPFMDVRRLW